MMIMAARLRLLEDGGQKKSDPWVHGSLAWLRCRSTLPHAPTTARGEGRVVVIAIGARESHDQMLWAVTEDVKRARRSDDGTLTPTDANTMMNNHSCAGYQCPFRSTTPRSATPL